MIKEQVFDIVKWLSENVYNTVFPKRQNMKETTETLESFKSSYDLNSITDPNSLLFIDIETTGFTARISYIISGVPSSGLRRNMKRKRI